jgi:protease PrsW
VLDSARFGRTNALFLLALALCSLVAILALVLIVAQRGVGPAVVGLVLGVLPIPVLVALVLYVDRLEPEPRALLAAIFGAGAGIAVLTSLLGRALNTGALTAPELAPHASVTAPVSIGAAIGGAILAQALNGLVLLALLASRPTEIDGVEDGVVYGSMVGLGFGLVANVYGYAVALNAGAGTLGGEFVKRGVVGPAFQALFTSLIGLGVAYAAARPADSNRYLVLGSGWLAAVVLDTLWNHSVSVTGAWLLATYLILFGALVVLGVTVVADRRRVVLLINGFLPSFEDPEIVTGEDIRMLTSLRLRRLGRHWARLNLGIEGTRAMTKYQLAATELAMACRRNELGQTTEDTFVSHRDDSLELMRTTAAIIRGQEQLYPPPWIAPDAPSVFVPYQYGPAAGQ